MEKIEEYEETKLKGISTRRNICTKSV